jgi:hypothetical protein
MTATATISTDGSKLTVRLPLAIRRRGARKAVVAPRGTAVHPPRPHVDRTLVKAIARAYRWQRLLEEGTYASMRDLAAAEKISPTYISRLLRLTLLAPEIVEAVLDGRHALVPARDVLVQPFSDGWESQRLSFEAALL